MCFPWCYLDSCKQFLLRTDWLRHRDMLILTKTYYNHEKKTWQTHRTCSLSIVNTHTFCFLCLFYDFVTISLSNLPYISLTLLLSLSSSSSSLFLNLLHTYGSRLCCWSYRTYHIPLLLILLFFSACLRCSSLPLHHTHSHHTSAPAIF